MHAEDGRHAGDKSVLEAPFLDSRSVETRFPTSAPGNTWSTAVWEILEAVRPRSREQALPGACRTGDAPNGRSGAFQRDVRYSP
jgi:hypothetical protein